MAFDYAVALTGGIAAGKSTVAALFSQVGFPVIDADTIAHAVLDAQHAAVGEIFGEALIHEERVDRKALGAIVFADPARRRELEALLHPLIEAEIAAQATKKDTAAKPYLIDIPLFFEREAYPIERSVVVYAPRPIQLERLIQREGFSEAEALRRIEAQMNIEEKRRRATWVIDNSGDRAHLQGECERVKQLILDDFSV